MAAMPSVHQANTPKEVLLLHHLDTLLAMVNPPEFNAIFDALLVSGAVHVSNEGGIVSRSS
jgi:hypothetical protein